MKGYKYQSVYPIGIKYVVFIIGYLILDVEFICVSTLVKYVGYLSDIFRFCLIFCRIL